MKTNIEQPLVSVLMTAYNRQDFISDSIESVLSSNYSNFELIIVDDCSVDRTAEIAKKYESQDVRIKVIVNEKNLGQFKNRNKAASLAKGQYIKYVDSDDLIYPYTLNIMVGAMLQFPEAGMGFCHTIHESEVPYPFIYTPESAFLKHYFGGGLLYTGPIGLIIKTEVFNTLNGFEEYGMPSDNHFSLKLASLYNVIALPRDLFYWRNHNQGRAFDSISTIENIFDHFHFNRSIIKNSRCPLSKEFRDKALYNGQKNLIKGIVRHLINSPSSIFSLKRNFKKYLNN